MKNFLLLASILLSQILFASNFSDYKNHIANDRIILVFDKNVSVERKAEIIQSSGLVSSFTHLPTPALTICLVNDFNEAQKFFSSFSEINFISFFITDGKHHAGVMDDFFVKIKDKSFEPLLHEKLEQENLGEAIHHKYIPNLYSIKNLKSTTKNSIEISVIFQSEAWVEYSTPNYLFNPLVTSNDQHYFRQWSIANTGSIVQGNGTPDADMDVDSAWTITTGSPTIKIGVIDSGTDTLHIDLKDNLLPGHDAVSDSTDGYPTPNFAQDGHGTCTAGIIGAVKDNNWGIAGIAPSCKIIPVRAFYYVLLGSEVLPFSTAAIFADAFGWSANVAHADLLSNSWGLPAALIGLLQGGTQPVNDAILQAYSSGRNGKGIPMFFSSGNEEDNTGPIWPGSLQQTISVNATSMCDERKNALDCSSESWSGNWGNGLDISAPGVRITTTDMRGNKGYSSNDYTFTFNGTSAACPNAAGVGALLLSIRPDLSAEDVCHIIAVTCDKVGGYAYNTVLTHGAWSRELGYGRVNAFSAVQHALTYSSIEKTANEIQLKIFPNPTEGIIHVLYSGEKSAMLKIFDLTGKELFASTLHQGENKLDVSALSKGIYLVKMEVGEKGVTRKIVVQ